jgi:5-methylcytosine-specific restriction protein A
MCRRERATEVHHVIPRRMGGNDHPSNLQALCRMCHSSQTARENIKFPREAPGTRRTP